MNVSLLGSFNEFEEMKVDASNLSFAEDKSGYETVSNNNMTWKTGKSRFISDFDKSEMVSETGSFLGGMGSFI